MPELGSRLFGSSSSSFLLLPSLLLIGHPPSLLPDTLSISQICQELQPFIAFVHSIFSTRNVNILPEAFSNDTNKVISPLQGLKLTLASLVLVMIIVIQSVIELRCLAKSPPLPAFILWVGSLCTVDTMWFLVLGMRHLACLETDWWRRGLVLLWSTLDCLKVLLWIGLKSTFFSLVLILDPYGIIPFSLQIPAFICLGDCYCIPSKSSRSASSAFKWFLQVQNF